MHLPPVLVTSIGPRCTWRHCVDIPRFYRFCWRQRWPGPRFLAASGQWKSEYILQRSIVLCFFCIGSAKNARFVCMFLVGPVLDAELVTPTCMTNPPWRGYHRVLWLQLKQWRQGPIPSNPMFYQIFLLTTVIVYLLGSSPDQLSSPHPPARASVSGVVDDRHLWDLGLEPKGHMFVSNFQGT